MQAEPLLSLAATVAGEHRTDDVLAAVVRGLARQPGVALARIWLLSPGDLCDSCFLRAQCPDQVQCLHLAASAGSPLHSAGEDWSFLQGHFRRIPLRHGKVGRIGNTGQSVLVGDLAPESEWFIRQDWAALEQIRGFAGHALVHRGKILGVLGVFTREPLYEQDFAWLKMFADQAAVAIANARAFEDLVRAEAAQRERELQLHELRLRQVAGYMQARMEERLEERERIARDLHDTLLQGFLSAYMQLDVANDRLPADSPAKPLVQHVLDLMKQVSEEGRNAIRSLRSPHPASDGLEERLSGIREEFSLQEQVDFRVVVEGKPIALHPLIREEVYRIAREAVINAFRHSEAGRIEVEIKYAARSLRVMVRDNGCGVDPKVLRTGREGHWGLSNMRERAEKIGAKFAVLSRAGAGTEVELSVPGKVAFETVSSQGWSKRLTRWLPAKTAADVPPSRE